MTVSWGGLGVIWGKNVTYIFVRESRYTKEFIDNGEFFSLSFLDKEYKEDLAYCGSTSGRDEDKWAKSQSSEKQSSYQKGSILQGLQVAVKFCILCSLPKCFLFNTSVFQ